MLELMKPFVDTFMANQREEVKQWLDWWSDSFEGEDNDEEETDGEGSDKGELANDEAS